MYHFGYVSLPASPPVLITCNLESVRVNEMASMRGTKERHFVPLMHVTLEVIVRYAVGEDLVGTQTHLRRISRASS